MTAHYNGYFNARELIKESLMTYRTAYKEDYTQILPVYVYPKDQDVATVFKPMNDAVEKTERVINKHSMPNPTKVKGKNEEWCKWIDENWLVMGQAYFYKREYSPAIEKFDYITKAYKYDVRKYDALIWEAKSYIELKDYLKADEIFIQLEEKLKEAEDSKKKGKTEESKKKSNKNSKGKKSSGKKSKKDKPQVEPPFPKELKDELYTAQADMYLRQEKYDKAIDYLKLAIEFTKKKRDRARLTFILAQIYEKKMDYGSATEQYSTVLKLNPTFEMEFYATINRALIYQGGDSRSIKMQLMRMLKDEKNKDFFDQIYYALGEIEMKEGDKAKGVHNFKRSVATSISNDRQKGRSYLKLADIYFADRDFVPSKTYYDSAVTFLPPAYPKYIEIKLKSESLTELVNNLNEYHLQDSLLNLSKLDRGKLEKRLEEIIKQQNEEDERKRLEEQAKKEKIPDPSESVPGGWYFYNATSMAQGQSEFKKKWGTRKNENNWRRINKSQILEDGTTGNGEDSTLTASIGGRSKEDYLKKIPLTDYDKEASHKKLRAALYNAAVIYRSNFNEDQLALTHFKELVKRYSEGPEVCPSYYQIYLIGNGNAESNDAKNRIFQDCPDSEYRYIIEDPNYAQKSEQNKSKDENAYMLVYQEFSKGKFVEVLEKVSYVAANEKTNQYLPNYLFLKALCYGELKNLEEMDKALSDVVARYPVHEVGKEAAAMLDFLRNKKSTEDARSGLSTYIFEKNAEHYFVMILPQGEGAVNDVKVDFSDFNTQLFGNDGLKVSNNFLDLNNQLVIVKSFVDKQKAMEYYTAFKFDANKVKKYSEKQFFVISNKNYAAFFTDKKVADYKKFFEENYLK